MSLSDSRRLLVRSVEMSFTGMLTVRLARNELTEVSTSIGRGGYHTAISSPISQAPVFSESLAMLRTKELVPNDYPSV